MWVFCGRAKQDKTILTQIKEQLGLQLEDDWGFLCTSMDLIEDSNLAIENFAKFQLEGPTKYNDEGEKYLRLYGFLNAVHIQQNALVTLFALLKVPGKGELIEKVQKLKIRNLRHKLAAHQDSFLNKVSNEKQAFYLSRIDLYGTNIGYGNNVKFSYERIDLRSPLKEHGDLVIDTLDVIYEKSIKTIYKANKNKQEEFVKDLELLRHEKRGDFVIRMLNSEPLVITLVSANPQNEEA